MDVEIREQNDKRKGITDESPVHPVWKITARVDGPCSVSNSEGELSLKSNATTN